MTQWTIPGSYLLRVLSVEEAIRRMTAYPAERAGLQGIGRIMEGAWADLTIFDPETIRDNGYPERFDAPPTGIQAVIISGEPAACEGHIVPGAMKGRLLRKV